MICFLKGSNTKIISIKFQVINPTLRDFSDCFGGKGPENEGIGTKSKISQKSKQRICQ